MCSRRCRSLALVEVDTAAGAKDTQTTAVPQKPLGTPPVKKMTAAPGVEGLMSCIRKPPRSPIDCVKPRSGAKPEIPRSVTYW